MAYAEPKDGELRCSPVTLWGLSDIRDPTGQLSPHIQHELIEPLNFDLSGGGLCAALQNPPPASAASSTTLVRDARDSPYPCPLRS